jgi:hypothetical protein
MPSAQVARLRTASGLLFCALLVGLTTYAVFRARSAVERWGNLSALPPESVFTRVFGIAPPPGVTGIVAAGHAPFNGEAWLRFEAADVGTVLAALKRIPQKPLAGPEAKFDPNDWRVLPRGESAAWSRMVGWGSLRHAKKREYYTFHSPGYSGWGGVVVVDRRRKLFFVSAVIY